MKYFIKLDLIQVVYQGMQMYREHNRSSKKQVKYDTQ